MSGALISSFVFDLEQEMKVVSEDAYSTLLANLWWQQVAVERPIGGKKEVLHWLLDSASIEYSHRLGGDVIYDKILSQMTTLSYRVAEAGLQLNRQQMTDLENGVKGGEAMRLGAHWSRQMGALFAYWPQEKLSAAINAGEAATSLAYDGEKFFDTDHPVNPFDSSIGVYANVFTGAPSGSYPGALPIDASVTVDVAVNNIGKAVAYIQSIKMPNGKNPRNLRVRGILAPSALTTRVQQITNAKYIAQAAATGGGGADIEAVVRNWGFAPPLEAPELGAAFTNGSDTSYYLLVQQVTGRELGPLVYANRDPFAIQYHDGVSDVELDRANSLEWIARGANDVFYGHPFHMFKCKST